jgi:hypothetical protein
VISSFENFAFHLCPARWAYRRRCFLPEGETLSEREIECVGLVSSGMLTLHFDCSRVVGRLFFSCFGVAA